VLQLSACVRAGCPCLLSGGRSPGRQHCQHDLQLLAQAELRPHQQIARGRPQRLRRQRGLQHRERPAAGPLPAPLPDAGVASDWAGQASRHFEILFHLHMQVSVMVWVRRKAGSSTEVLVAVLHQATGTGKLGLEQQQRACKLIS
jgi:hypothetical protein